MDFFAAMDDTFFAALILAFCLVAGSALSVKWVHDKRRKHKAARRAHGYELIHSLRAYSAWIECQRDLPFTTGRLDELTSPEPLARARQIKQDWFPELSHNHALLLQAHDHMVEYLWEQSTERLGQGAGGRQACGDAKYQQLRGAQEDLIDEMIATCRELIGDSDMAWRATGSDFAFSNSVGSNGPASQV